MDNLIFSTFILRFTCLSHFIGNPPCSICKKRLGKELLKRPVIRKHNRYASHILLNLLLHSTIYYPQFLNECGLTNNLKTVANNYYIFSKQKSPIKLSGIFYSF